MRRPPPVRENGTVTASARASNSPSPAEPASTERASGHPAWAAVTEDALLAEATAAGHSLDAEQLAAVQAMAAGHRRGVYLHGAVGRGKSWLADRVLHLVATSKRRLHLHAFLAELSRLMARERLPLPEAVLQLVGDARFLLLDEFHVHDIADAIMLRRTIVTLLEADVALLMTSNYPPGRLLPDLTFHEAILPAIRAIEAELDVVHLAGEHDYRGQSEHVSGFAAGSWTVVPDGEWSGQVPDANVEVRLSPTRTLRALAVTEARGELEPARVVVHWDEICAAGVSVNDHLTVARRFGRVDLVGVPAPERIEPEAFQRLAYLLDVLVDTDRELHVTAAVSRSELARASRLPRDAERMLSRLSMLRP